MSDTFGAAKPAPSLTALGPLGVIFLIIGCLMLGLVAPLAARATAPGFILLAVLGGHGELTASGIFNDFIVHFIGGGIAGFAMGRLACFLFAWLRGFPTAEITLTLTLAYLSFFISEHYLNVSGVVATVIAGLVVGSTGRTRMSPTTFEYLSSAWEQFGFWANSLIFLFAAMLIPKLMAAADWQELVLVAVVFVATLVARAIGESRMLLCASPAYLRRRPAIRQPEDLLGLDWLALNNDGPSGLSLTGPNGEVQRMRMESRVSCNNILAVRHFTLAGMGISLQPEQEIRAELADGSLVEVLPDWQLPPFAVYLVTPRRDAQPAKVRYAIEALRQHLLSP